MRIIEAEAALRDYLSGHGVVLERDGVARALDAIIAWYETERADDAATDDGDMLLLQWGPFDAGSGPIFQYGLTRQFVEAANPEDEGIHQLSVTFQFEATAATEASQRGSRWCYAPADVAAFRDTVRAEAATAFAYSETPLDVVILFEVAG